MNRKSFLQVLAIGALALASCGKGQTVERFTFWTPTADASQTPIVVVQTTTALPTQTPIFVEITNTPKPTSEVLAKCVLANVTVHLRPSPNTSGYPIQVLANNQKVSDLGGRVGKWWFVSVGKNQGWVDSAYLVDCTDS